MKLVMISGLGAGCELGSEVLAFQRAAQVIPAAQGVPFTVAEIVDETRGALATVRAIADQVAGAASSLREQLVAAGALIPRAQAVLAAPLQPTNLFLHGMAYHSHARDWDEGAKPAPPSHPPAGFHKSLGSINAPEAPIVIPAIASGNVDFEGELCVVFGRECHAVSRAEAMDYVAGFTILNDVSARDWIPKLRDKNVPPIPPYFALNTMYKNFPTFCPLGPNVTTKDEIADYHAMRLTTRLNGELMQDATLAELIWDIPELIESYSAVNRFLPGDVMSTGTPGGVGAGRNPPRFLRDGDLVSVEVSGIGKLNSPVRGPLQ